jgi:hypothetical protein
LPWIRLFLCFQDHQSVKWVGDDGPATEMWLMSRMGQDVGPGNTILSRQGNVK